MHGRPSSSWPAAAQHTAPLHSPSSRHRCRHHCDACGRSILPLLLHLGPSLSACPAWALAVQALAPRAASGPAQLTGPLAPGDQCPCQEHHLKPDAAPRREGTRCPCHSEGRCIKADQGIRKPSRTSDDALGVQCTTPFGSLAAGKAHSTAHFPHPKNIQNSHSESYAGNCNYSA